MIMTLINHCKIVSSHFIITLKWIIKVRFVVWVSNPINHSLRTCVRTWEISFKTHGIIACSRYEYKWDLIFLLPKKKRKRENRWWWKIWNAKHIKHYQIHMEAVYSTYMHAYIYQYTQFSALKSFQSIFV